VKSENRLSEVSQERRMRLKEYLFTARSSL
jgi:hypothetical protein